MTEAEAAGTEHAPPQQPSEPTASPPGSPSVSASASAAASPPAPESFATSAPTFASIFAPALAPSAPSYAPAADPAVGTPVAPGRADPAGVVRLLGADLPADQGLSSLGLIMQLGGSLSAALVVFFGFAALLVPAHAGTTLAILLITTLSVVRSMMHRAAGNGILYGTQPLRGVRRYIAVALAHSALFSAMLMYQGVSSAALAVSIGAAFAVWPILLLVLFRMPRLRRFEEEVPSPEDKGFEGAAVLMTVLGIAGLASGLLLLGSLLSGPGALALRDMRILLVLCALLLVARSCTHLFAGVTGLRNLPLDTAVERVGQYANLGLVSAFVTSGVLLVTSMSGSLGFFGILFIVVSGWMLAAWPMALRRFFAERQFASLLAGDAAPIHRRAPDAGLTSLGWLLLACGALSLAFFLATFSGVPADDGSLLMGFYPLLGGSWHTAITAGLMLFAGLELVRMTPQHRLTATIAAVTVLVVELSAWSPGFAELSQLSDGLSGLGALPILVGPLGLALATIILVNRKIAPTAQAMVRKAH